MRQRPPSHHASDHDRVGATLSLTGPLTALPRARPRRPVVGLMLPTAAHTDDGHMDPGRAIEAARRAEAAGFDGVYVGDHLLHPRPLLESIVTLSVIAASTQRVSLGPCVVLLALRNPVVLAKQLGTLASFAPGRLRVGVGVGGEYPAEFAAVGVRLSERGRRLEEGLREVQGLLSGRIRPRGPDGTDVTIAPVGEEIPFLLAGRKDVALRRAARYGDGWIGYLLDPDGFARRRSFLSERRRELLRESDPFTTGMLLPVHVDASPGGARARAAAAWASLTRMEASFPERLFVAGPVGEVVEQLRRYWDAGCTELILGPADQGTGYLDQVDLLAEGVLPQIRAFA
jgi:alkanesulfonate monooxygenase SsuD/methylene tetrahydromethanopterin reductase-like flavin-dependent oxidoreductase (luciferase family)